MGSGGFFLHALIVALSYTVNQDKRGQKSTFLFFSVPAQALPYCIILMSLIMGGGIMTLLTGIVAAHLHDFLTRLWPEFGGGRNLLPTPGFVSWLVQTPRVLQRRYGTAIRQPDASATSGASTGSVLPDAWKTRGGGHRLGGN